MNTPQRIIDANANRTREALRVLEEAARFVLQSEPLANRLKHLRHDFMQALPDTTELIAHRDTPGDVGTTISTEAEQSRQTISDVVAAAGGRLSEALRVIEEYSKLDELGPDYHRLAKTAEKIRYHGYEVTQSLLLAVDNHSPTQWSICLLLTQSLCTHHDWRTVLEQSLSNGVARIQVREKNMQAGPLLAHIKEVVALVKGSAAVIVNDRPDLALLGGADGVHLGQGDLNPLEARKLLGKRAIVGVSTSNLGEAKRAKAEGADYCGVGPMFPTTTKHKPIIAGPAYLRDYLQWAGLPHLAIGGITPDNIGELVEAGCQGVAVSSTICGAKDPGETSAMLSNAFKAGSYVPDSQSSAITDA